MSEGMREIELYIFDIYIAIYKIQDIIKDFQNAKSLLYSYRDWDSLIREFEIIGEASKYLLRENVIESEYQVVVDFRNKISHGYFGIDEDVVWHIAHNDLSSLLETIENLIVDMEPGLRQELLDAYKEDNYHLAFIIEALERLENEKKL